jgi:hypothetical protein
MPFDWTEYVGLAKALVNQAGPEYTLEASLRSAARNQQKKAAGSPASRSERYRPPYALVTRSQGIHSLCSSSRRRR